MKERTFAVPAPPLGLSPTGFGPALKQFLGTGQGVSAATVTRLTRNRQGEATAFGQHDLSGYGSWSPGDPARGPPGS